MCLELIAGGTGKLAVVTHQILTLAHTEAFFKAFTLQMSVHLKHRENRVCSIDFFQDKRANM